MRSVISALVLLVIASTLTAAEEPRPNHLTSKEIADGWLLLFDGETTFGWQIEGEAKVEDGVLILGGEKASRAVSSTAFDWDGSLYSLELELRWEGKTTPTFMFLGGMLGLTEAAKEKFTPQKVTVNSVLANPIPPARPMRFETPAGSRLFVRNLKYRPLGLKTIFNGKDLTGWKEFPDRKSRFTVTPEGWLNIKDGPGDLQTASQWDDFVLQLECISNGKHLNSGVFFRCQPDKYQQGYEAQVRNQFTAEPTQEYTIDIYDPATNKLKDKQKIKFTAVDYGTGAIYRRVPARRQSSKDNEWFTLTVMARGRHFATWVNGIQQVDWTDNRPPADNGRNGCRLEKGPISFQGHDPTTDLSFRNIRIAELPKPPAKK